MALSNERIEQLNACCKLLNYQFSDLELLDQALTHRSFNHAHYERMEFLGDAVLGMVIAEALYARFPDAKEGDLSRLRSRLVRGHTVAKLAKELQLGKFLALGEGERKSGGHRRVSILEDALEAIIGAMYSDSDFNTCRSHILNWYEDRIENLSETDMARDAKSRLQEVLQSQGKPLPVYELIDTTGPDHEQVFLVSCIVNDTLSTQADARSRKQAEQRAAAKALAMLAL